MQMKTPLLSLFSSLALALSLAPTLAVSAQEVSFGGSERASFLSVTPVRSQRPAVVSAPLLEERLAAADGQNVSTLLSPPNQPCLRWAPARMPLKVYIDSGFMVAGFRPGYSFVLKRCFDDWAAASANAVTFTFVEDKASADIACAWVSDARELHDPGAASEAEIFAENGYINRASLGVLVNWSHQDFSVADAKIRRVGLYAIGRTLGLLGRTANVGDAMCATIADSQSMPRLSERDRQALRLLYKEGAVAIKPGNARLSD